MTLLTFALLSLATMTTARIQLPSLFIETPSGIGIAVGSAAQPWTQPLPLEVETTFRNGSSVWTRGAYAALYIASDGLTSTANGTLKSPGGTVFSFCDTYSNATDGGFSVSRVVSIVAIGVSEEFAFSSRFSIFSPSALVSLPRQLFVPGVSYQNATALPKGALAGDPQAPHILIREDRLPLPLALVYFPDMRDGNGSGAARLLHVHPDASTIDADDFTQRIVDAGLQYGSLGFLNDATPAGGPSTISLCFQFPGSEGDRTYVYDPDKTGWANRSHPIAAGVPHAYELRFDWETGGSAGYYGAAVRAWRAAFAAFAPTAPVAPSPDQVYSDGMDVLASYGVTYTGVPSMPFEASLPGGVVIDTSSQMGFVGRALPAAALLLYDAVVARPNATRRARAAAIVDVWATQAMNTCGVPKTWYDITATGSVTWRTSDAYQGSIRIMSDGMKGMIDAWHVEGTEAEWLAAAVRYADFLVAKQAADGSMFTSWNWDCQPIALDTRQTPHIIPFLVAMYNATNDERYRAAALSAGSYAVALFATQFSYEGGAVDNPDVPDKEAGWLAAQAFIALYELTRDAVWLAPASQAASYAATFVYSWNVPIACSGSPVPVYPCNRTTLGASLIATGQSGADNYMAISHYDYARLGSWLQDDHFRDFAAFLEPSTTQVLDWDGSLGYAARGLMTEAATFSVRRGTGVKDWLPWLTANILYPLVQRQQDKM